MHNRNIVITVALLIVLLSTVSLLALDSGFTVVNQGEDFTEIEFVLNDFELEPVEVSGETYHRFNHPERGFLLDEGLPELMTYSALVAIPNRGRATLQEVSIYDSELIRNIRIFPSQGFDLVISDKAGFLINEGFYGKDIDYPAHKAMISPPSVMREMRLISLTLFPFSFNPQREELTVNRKFRVRISYDKNTTGENELLIEQRTYSRSFENILSESVLNFSQFRDSNLDYQNRSLLIIHHHNQTILPTVQQIAEWKRNKGFVVNTVSTQNLSSNNAIKNYIQNAFDTWNDPPEYVLLVGNGTGSLAIPYFTAHAAAGDHQYSLLAGNDDLADVFLGRFFVDSLSQLQTVWNKIRNYERFPYMVNQAWYRNTLLVGDPATSGISTVITCKYVKESILREYPQSTFTEVYQSPFPSQINDGINSGANMYLYRGLENTSQWSPSETQLSNGLMLPNVALMTCGTLSYTTSNRSVSVVNLGTPTTSRGGVSAIGSSSSATATAFNNALTGGMFYGIYRQGMRTMSEALLRGELYLWQCYANTHPSQPPRYSQWFNLVGDPSMDIWVDVPKSISVSYENNLPYGSNSIFVRVTDSLNQPVGKSWVTVRCAQTNYAVSAYTGEDGEAVLLFDPSLEGEINLTVTKPDYRPYLGNFYIDQEPAVSFAEVIVNGDLHSGNQVDFVLLLRNHGDVQRDGVRAMIHTDSDYVSVIDFESTYGSIPSGEIRESHTNYRINIDENAPDGYNAIFLATITDLNENLWKSRFSLSALNANLEVTGIYLNNQPSGIIEPGENGTVGFSITNNGHIGIDDLYARLYPGYGVTVPDSILFLGDISAGETLTTTTENSFSITLAGNLITGMMPNLVMELYNDTGFYQLRRLEFTVGQVTVNDPLGPDEYGYWCYDSGDTDYLYVPEYDWIEIAPQNGGSGTNTGLGGDHNNNQQVLHRNLPFPFKFYGIEYEQISICTNGWISFGITEQAEQRNWRLPGPLGPSAMVAAFWDNLSLSQGGVYTYYDASENSYIIQWEKARNIVNNAEETFQIILYDPEHHLTSTGDGPIKIQYKVVNNVNHGLGSPYGNWGNYATVGIADHNCQIGLEYTFGNRYPTAARELHNGMALFFTTSTDYYEPYVIMDSFSIIEYENENPHYGDIINLGMTLTNVGSETAGNVVANLSSNDQYVEIIDNTAGFGAITSEGFATVEQAFTVAIADNVPHEHQIQFDLNLTAAGFLSWTQRFRITVNAPKLSNQNLIVYDPAPGGNNNGLLDPGETAFLYLPITNIGGSDSQGLTIDVASYDPSVTINYQENTTLSGIKKGESHFTTLNVTIDEDVLPGQGFVFYYTAHTGRYSFSGQAFVGMGGYVEAQLGSGTSTNSSMNPNPINIYSRSLRTQTVYTVEELNEAGVSGGEAIVRFGYYVQSAPIHPLPNFRIRMGHTTANNASEHYSGPLMTVFNPAQYVPTAGGWDMLTLSEPYVWNGVDNLLVDTSFSMVAGWNSSGRQRIYQTPNSFRYVASDNSNVMDQQTTTMTGDKPQLMLVFDSTVGSEGTSIPRNLTAVAREDGLFLEWEEPDTSNDGQERAFSSQQREGSQIRTDMHSLNRHNVIRTPLGYNLYRNGKMINTEPLEELTYLDTAVEDDQEYFYYVTALYENSESKPSGVVSVRMTPSLAEPYLYPPSGVFQQPIMVEITTDIEDAIIYYTIDGTEPNEESYLYEQAIEIVWHTHLRAKAYKDGYIESSVVTAEYFILYAPEEFTAEVADNDVYLVWQTPWSPQTLGYSSESADKQLSMRTLTGYNVYRSLNEEDFLAVNTEPIIETEFLDTELVAGEYQYYVIALYEAGESAASETISLTISEISSADDDFIEVFETRLFSAYPNPFNPRTTIEFSLKEDSQVELEIYNIAGMRVKTLVNQPKQLGKHRVIWEGTNDSGKKVGSGIYFYRLKTPDYQEIKKIIMLK